MQQGLQVTSSDGAELKYKSTERNTKRVDDPNDLGWKKVKHFSCRTPQSWAWIQQTMWLTMNSVHLKLWNCIFGTEKTDSDMDISSPFSVQIQTHKIMRYKKTILSNFI